MLGADWTGAETVIGIVLPYVGEVSSDRTAGLLHRAVRYGYEPTGDRSRPITPPFQAGFPLSGYAIALAAGQYASWNTGGRRSLKASIPS